MTGEITLRGKVLPIGGLKEKSMAAFKAGVKTVFIPKDNVPDLEEVDKLVRESITFIPVENFTEVLNAATVEPVVAKDRGDNLILPKNSKLDSQLIRQ